ncbi:MAG: hypothetical protein U5L11_09375 [Arhodomonas sp.]|nr:hypothetical protein [Arhodomonas sp.]
MMYPRASLTLLLLAAFFINASAQAGFDEPQRTPSPEYLHMVLLDTDGDPATGCDFPAQEAGKSGPVEGIDAAVWVARYGTQLHSPLLLNCDEGDNTLHGGPAALNGGETWEVATNAGIALEGGDNADAIEWGVALSALGIDTGATIRATFFSTGETVASDVMAVTDSNSAGRPCADPHARPVGHHPPGAAYSPEQAYPRLRRYTGGSRPWSVSAAGASLLLGGITMVDSRANGSGFPLGGLLSVQEFPTASISLGSDASDWSGVTPIATDPTGDSSEDDDGEDMVAGFIARDANNLYFRVDVVNTEQVPF